MAYQKVFKNDFVGQLEKKLEQNDEPTLKLYEKDVFPVDNAACLIDVRLSFPDEVKLIEPDGKNKHSFENAKIIYETLKNLPLIKASDPGLWTYLTHVTFWKYMRTRWSTKEQPQTKKGQYILEHWFVRNIGAADLARNGISSLWWGCYLTFDEKRHDSYELTKQLFTMLDFYRTLIGGIQGRNKAFTHALLEFVIDNKGLFERKKEGKVRLLMRKANAVGGYKLFTALSKEQIKDIFSGFTEEIEHYSDD